MSGLSTSMIVGAVIIAAAAAIARIGLPSEATADEAVVAEDEVLEGDLVPVAA
jgi:hypothetical protein